MNPEHLTRNFFLTLGLVAIALMSAAVILGVLDTDRAPQQIVRFVQVQDLPSVQPVVYLSVTPEIKPGLDGKLHDAFSTTEFYTKAGFPLKLVVNNTDNVPHGFEVPGTNLVHVFKPGVHSYVLLIDHPGKYAWHCFLPCDPFSMEHVDYMRGFITVI